MFFHGGEMGPGGRPSQALRVVCLATVFLACRFGLQLALVPALFITFSVRWFVVNPPPATKHESAPAGSSSTTSS